MRRTVLGTGVVAISIVLFVHALSVPVESTFGRVIHPVGGWLYGAGAEIRNGIKTTSDRFFSSTTVDNEEITRLRLELIEQRGLKEENDRLHDELEFLTQHEFEHLSADVVNYQPDRSRDLLRIYVGSDERVSENLPVVSGGVLVGVIDHLEGEYATVMLISDIDFRSLVTIEGATGVLSGQVGRELLVESIPRNQGVEPGSLVLTSGQDGIFPPDLLIGSVRRLSQAQGGIFERAHIESEANLRNLRAVTVLLP